MPFVDHEDFGTHLLQLGRGDQACDASAQNQNFGFPLHGSHIWQITLLVPG
jgi:hypothetical protein